MSENNKKNDEIKDGVYDPYVEGYKKWKKEQEEHDKYMKPHLLKPEDKGFELPDLRGKFMREVELKCNCGTEAVYGKIAPSGHSDYCDIFKAK